jgi:hypothetical protein
LGYSLQAKKVVQGHRHLTYPRLSEGGLPPARFQYDTLLDHAANFGTVAVHVLYNGWKLIPGAPHQGQPDPRVYGCAAILTSDLKRLREAGGRQKSNKAVTFARHSMPWSDLFRLPPPSGVRTPVPSASPGPRTVRPAMSPTPADAASLIRWLYREDWGDHPPRPRTELPPYVQGGIDRTVAQLPDKPELPRFAVVIDVGTSDD